LSFLKPANLSSHCFRILRSKYFNKDPWSYASLLQSWWLHGWHPASYSISTQWPATL